MQQETKRVFTHQPTTFDYADEPTDACLEKWRLQVLYQCDYILLISHMVETHYMQLVVYCIIMWFNFFFDTYRNGHERRETNADTNDILFLCQQSHLVL